MENWAVHIEIYVFVTDTLEHCSGFSFAFSNLPNSLTLGINSIESAKVFCGFLKQPSQSIVRSFLNLGSVCTVHCSS